MSEITDLNRIERTFKSLKAEIESLRSDRGILARDNERLRSEVANLKIKIAQVPMLKDKLLEVKTPYNLDRDE